MADDSECSAVKLKSKQEEIFEVEPGTGVDVFKVIEERWRRYASTKQAREDW